MLVELPSSFLAFEKDFQESLRHIAITDMCHLFQKYDTNNKTQFASLLKNKKQALQHLLTDPITKELFRSAIFLTDDNHILSFDEEDWYQSFNVLYSQKPSTYGEYYDFTNTYYWLTHGKSPLTRIKKNLLIDAKVLNDFVHWCLLEKLIFKESGIDIQAFDTQLSRLIKNEIKSTNMSVYNFYQADFLLRLAYLYGIWPEKVKSWIYQAAKKTDPEDTLPLLFVSGLDNKPIKNPICFQQNSDSEKIILLDQRNQHDVNASTYTQIQNPKYLNDLFDLINNIEIYGINKSNLTLWLILWLHNKNYVEHEMFFIEKLKLTLMHGEATLLETWSTPNHYKCHHCNFFYQIEPFHKGNNIIDVSLKLFKTEDVDDIIYHAIERLNADQIIKIMSNYSNNSQKNTFYTCIEKKCHHTVKKIIEQTTTAIADLIRPVYASAFPCRNTLLDVCKDEYLKKKLESVIAIIELFRTYLNPPLLSWLARTSKMEIMESDLQKIFNFLSTSEEKLPPLSDAFFDKTMTLVSQCIENKIWSKQALFDLFHHECNHHLAHTKSLSQSKIASLSNLADSFSQRSNNRLKVQVKP